MSDALPKYDRPPLVESVISIQFAPLVGFTDAHAGWFWKKHLPPEWAKIQIAMPIEDRFERFGADRLWKAETPSFSLRQGPAPSRSQFSRQDDERMIQIQASRFIYNWHKLNGKYPTFDILFEEFSTHFAAFHEFVREAGLGTIQANQWELTYVNHIPRGELWRTVSEWGNVIPHFQPIVSGVPGQELDTFQGEWQFALDGDRGRLHVTMKRARVNNDPDAEVIVLQQTARGPIDAARAWDLRSGLARGREAIDHSFRLMTDETVQVHAWQRKSQ